MTAANIQADTAPAGPGPTGRDWRSVLLTVCLALAAGLAWGNPNQHARILAGVEPIEGAEKTQSLARLFRERQSLFRPDNERLMRDFFARQVPRTLKSEGIIYLFGGPDVIYPQVVFPNFKTLLLVGLEREGELPDPTKLTPTERAQRIGEIGRAYSMSLQRSYFITSFMAKDLLEYGTTTIIATGLAAQGHEILGIQRVSLDVEGVVHPHPDNPTRGVRIQFKRPDGGSAEVLYFRFNLSDENMAKNPELARFIRRQPFDTAFYKAASFVSHNANFKSINTLVLDRVSLLLQADDGIPSSALMAKDRAPDWSFGLYGMYSPPSEVFGVPPQASLKRLFGRAVCRDGTAGDQALWEKLWATGPCVEESASDFKSVKWMGYLPFRFGYAAVIGPRVVPAEEMNKLGTLMVLER